MLFAAWAVLVVGFALDLPPLIAVGGAGTFILSDRQRADLAWRAMSRRCREDDNWSLSRISRWRLTLKALLAVLFVARRSLYACSNIVIVAEWDFVSDVGAEGEMVSWDVLVVTRGWWRWRWDHFRDGAP